MGIFLTLRQSLLDLARGGPSFCLGGILSTFSRAETVGVKLSGDVRAAVRPGQSDFSTLRQVFRDQEYRLPQRVTERLDQEARRIRAKGLVPVIVDAGANIGAASIWFRSQFPDTTIVAIEPDPGNAAMARKNFSGLQGIVLVEAAIGAEEGFVSIIPAEQGWAVKTERSSDGCPVMKIDQAIKVVPMGEVLLVKIDIEGFESDLFNSNLGWLDDVVVVYIEPHDWMLPGKGTSRGFQKAFGERDFEIFLQGENLIYMRRGSIT